MEKLFDTKIHYPTHFIIPVEIFHLIKLGKKKFRGKKRYYKKWEKNNQMENAI